MVATSPAPGPAPHLQRVKQTVIYPSNLVEKFKEGSAENTNRNTETMATMAGYFNRVKNAWIVSDMIYPKQFGTATYCSETPGNYYHNYLIQKKLTQLGTIHTHPSFSSFMSCVDLRMHAGLQR